MAAGATYEPISTTTLANSTTASVTFSSIPSTYTDLIVVFTGAITPDADELNLQINGDTATNYSYTRLKGNGTSASSDRYSNVNHIHVGNAGVSSVQCNAIVQVMNYANSSTYKTVLSRENASNRDVMGIVGLWRSTSAITSLRLFCSQPSSFYFTSGSTFTLYGIAAA